MDQETATSEPYTHMLLRRGKGKFNASCLEYAFGLFVISKVARATSHMTVGVSDASCARDINQMHEKAIASPRLPDCPPPQIGIFAVRLQQNHH